MLVLSGADFRIRETKKPVFWGKMMKKHDFFCKNMKFF